MPSIAYIRGTGNNNTPVLFFSGRKYMCQLWLVFIALTQSTSTDFSCPKWLATAITTTTKVFVYELSVAWDMNEMSPRNEVWISSSLEVDTCAVPGDVFLSKRCNVENICLVQIFVYTNKSILIVLAMIRLKTGELLNWFHLVAMLLKWLFVALCLMNGLVLRKNGTALGTYSTSVH